MNPCENALKRMNVTRIFRNFWKEIKHETKHNKHFTYLIFISDICSDFIPSKWKAHLKTLDVCTFTLNNFRLSYDMYKHMCKVFVIFCITLSCHSSASLLPLPPPTTWVAPLLTALLKEIKEAEYISWNPFLIASKEG